ncbi:MAG TPA: selenium cofactor biosynthesis protein YqeC [Anaerolineaceae bacterium]|nr:selenium cofactor biosynthesis protein YqeC [Anaerolineaceae bacterium]
MKLADAFQVKGRFEAALVGAGGKTTAMFRLAQQLEGKVFLTTTTHLGLDQVALADQHFVVRNPLELEAILPGPAGKTILFSGPATDDGRVSSLNPETLNRLHEFSKEKNIHLLIEADGSRGLPLKAPADHEPAIPSWIERVIVVVGMKGLDQPLGPDWVHRAERFGAIAGILAGAAITSDAISKVLVDSEGGLKNIPFNAERIVLLNQADTAELQAQAGKIAQEILGKYRIAMIGSMNEPENEITACFKPVAGIVLAAGGSTRFGKSKPLLDWKGKPFVHKIVQTAMDAGLNPILVITGYEGEAVRDAVIDLGVKFVFNPDWISGQASSVKAGLQALPDETGGAIFLLADQPQVTVTLLKAELDLYRQQLPPVIAPIIDGRRANPVLFDRAAFPALQTISGDSGGRQVFSQFQVSWLEWNDRSQLLDVDTPEDYERLLRIQ